VKYGVPKIVTRFQYRTWYGPKNPFVIEYSDDGSTWTLAGTCDSSCSGAVSTSQSSLGIDISEPNAHFYWRFRLTDNFCCSPNVGSYYDLQFIGCTGDVYGAYFSVTGTASDFESHDWNLAGVWNLASNWGPKQDGPSLDYEGGVVSGSYFECCYPNSLAYVTLTCPEDPCTGKMTYMYWSGGANGMYVKILPPGSSESVMREMNDNNRLNIYRVNEWTTITFQWNDGDIFSMHQDYGHGFQLLELFTSINEPTLEPPVEPAAYTKSGYSQCFTYSTPYPGDRLDNPIFNGGGFIGAMTGSECEARCNSDHDPHGRPCVAIEHSSQNHDAVANCALAWACDYTQSWNGGAVYIRN